MARPLASLSLDLDNQWSYMKVHGDPGWQDFPSYLDRFVPLALESLKEHGLRTTWFVVGQDAALERNREALARIPAAGHEIGCHSFHHEPWLHKRTRAEVDQELAQAEDAIHGATGARPTGFRGPGYSLGPDVLEVLLARGYRFDASTLPTFLGPLARAYYFFHAKLTPEERAERSELFGTWRQGLRPVKPYQWELSAGRLLEIPVTTIPGCKVPFHLSYVLYLSTYSTWAARRYFRSALAACRTLGVEPSILLHPLDFLGADDVDALAFFPGMKLTGAEKRARVREWLGDLAQRFEVVPMGEHAERILERGGLRRRSSDSAA